MGLIWTLEENDYYTDLILKNDDIYFRTEDGKVSNTVRLS